MGAQIKKIVVLGLEWNFTAVTHSCNDDRGNSGKKEKLIIYTKSIKENSRATFHHLM